jgi:hypothetical protein
MRPGGRAIWVAAVLVGVAAAFALRGTPSGDSPEHRTDSDAANGTSVLPQLARALGHPTATLDSTFQPDLGMGVLFVLSPTVGFSRDEAGRLADYVAGGGSVVYAAERGDAQLDLTLQVSRAGLALASGDAAGTGPMLAGVGHVAGAVTAAALVPAPDQVVVLRSAGGQPIGVERLSGRGRVVVLTDPLPLCNGYLRRADNGRLAADLISLAPAGSGVAFDEYHHGVAGAESPLTAWLSTPWGAAIAWALVVVFVGLLLRGRAFGPRLRPAGGGHRSTLEYLAAVGALLHRARAAPATASLLTAATRRALAARHGLAPGSGFDAALRARAPADAAELAAAEAELRGGRGDGALLAAARRLHRLAYPEQPS